MKILMLNLSIFSLSQACTLLFMVLYFFTMAGSVWWVILTITWFLAAVPKWGSEAIEKKALLFHACAWGIPGVLTVSLLAMNKIEGDSVSGVCFVGLYNLTALRWFLLAPLGLDVVVRSSSKYMKWCLPHNFNCISVMRAVFYPLMTVNNNHIPVMSSQVGVALLLAGIAALNRVRMEIPLEKENQEKLVKFMIRIAVFSVLYLVPLLSVLGCYLYENNYRAVWETTWVQEKCRDYHIPCPYQVIYCTYLTCCLLRQSQLVMFSLCQSNHLQSLLILTNNSQYNSLRPHRDTEMQVDKIEYIFSFVVFS